MRNSSKSLPKTFGYIHELLPGVRQSIRYHSQENFLGRRVEGYDKDYSVLHTKAIEALRGVQNSANILGYDLLIYDAYRPIRAIKDIVEFLKDGGDSHCTRYHPKYTKQDLLSKYFVEYSSMVHSSGIAVDVTLINRNQKVTPIKWANKMYAGRTIPYAYDGSVDMYTSFLFFDESSLHDTKLIPDNAVGSRMLLKKLMTDHGFKSHFEWWHYELDLKGETLEHYDFIV